MLAARGKLTRKMLADELGISAVSAWRIFKRLPSIADCWSSKGTGRGTYYARPGADVRRLIPIRFICVSNTFHLRFIAFQIRFFAFHLRFSSIP